MKNLLTGFFINRDKQTESMRPLLVRSLARCVFFPDGKSLLEKWESDIKSSINVVHTTEITELENGSSFKWSVTTYGDSKFTLSCRFRPSVEYSPTIIGGDSTVQSSITITKRDSEGNVTEEDIPYGSNSGIKQFRFVIPVPKEFLNGKTANMNNASIIVSEGSDSDFIKYHTFHNVYSEYLNGNLFIYVDHYSGLDAVDMSNLPYITEDLSVMIDGLFI